MYIIYYTYIYVYYIYIYFYIYILFIYKYTYILYRKIVLAHPESFQHFSISCQDLLNIFSNDNF